MNRAKSPDRFVAGCCSGDGVEYVEHDCGGQGAGCFVRRCVCVDPQGLQESEANKDDAHDSGNADCGDFLVVFFVQSLEVFLEGSLISDLCHGDALHEGSLEEGGDPDKDCCLCRNDAVADTVYHHQTQWVENDKCQPSKDMHDSVVVFFYGNGESDYV